MSISLLHLIRRDVVDGAVDAEARVAHHHVEPAELLDRLRDEHVHVVFAGDVGDNGKRASAGRHDFRGDRVEPVAAAGADRDRRAVAREAQGGRASDAGGGAGDGDDTHHDSVARGLIADPVAELAFRGVEEGAKAAGVDEGLHRRLSRCGSAANLRTSPVT